MNVESFLSAIQRRKPVVGRQPVMQDSAVLERSEAELTEEDLEQVAGGLERVWTQSDHGSGQREPGLN